MYVIGLTSAHFCVHHQIFNCQFITEEALDKLMIGDKMDRGLFSIA